MLRRGWLALAPILVWTLAGCAWTETSEHSSWLQRMTNQAIGPDHALIQVALIERRPGDDYINERLWQHADELIVDLERHGVLDDNGFRIGQLVGPPPAEFQKLLLSNHCCSNPEMMIFPIGKHMPIHLGPDRAHASYETVLDKRRTGVEVDQARFCLDVVARFAGNGRTKLTFTPKVEHGAPTLPFRASPSKQEWEYEIEKASNTYPELSWEVTLAPNEYVFCGARMDRAKSLGRTAFEQQGMHVMVQRLLVIRNCRSLTSQEIERNDVGELVRADRTMPVALQAAVPAVRAKGNAW